jgi:nicotinamide riboside kinase
MGKVIWIPGSVGELLDKVSILNIKRVMITDTEKLVMVKHELQELMDVAHPFLENKEVEELYDLLLMVNKNLWDVEDVLRKMEADKLFDEEFIAKARSVYFLNDRRFELKSKINTVMGSRINEVKQYVQYQ